MKEVRLDPESRLSIVAIALVGSGCALGIGSFWMDQKAPGAAGSDLGWVLSLATPIFFFTALACSWFAGSTSSHRQLLRTFVLIAGISCLAAIPAVVATVMAPIGVAITLLLVPFVIAIVVANAGLLSGDCAGC